MLRQSRYEVRSLVDAYTGAGIIRDSVMASDLLFDGVRPDALAVSRDVLDTLQRGSIIEMKGSDIYWTGGGVLIGPYQNVLRELVSHPTVKNIAKLMKELGTARKASESVQRVKKELVHLSYERKALQSRIRSILDRMNRAT